MKKMIIAFILIGISWTGSYSQSCLPEGIVFSTQSQIDSFQINYPGCSRILGDVEIWGDDISNLDSLIVLTSIQGNLKIGKSSVYGVNPQLTSMNGLNSLDSIGGSLKLTSNIALQNLTGLEQLKFIGGELYIKSNEALRNLSGLQEMTILNDDLFICGNPSLEDLIGLDNITEIKGDITVGSESSGGNKALYDLNGLNNLSKIGGSLSFSYNPFTTADGLSNLDSIGGNFYINCTSLQSLAALTDLRYIGGQLTIGSTSVALECRGTGLLDLNGLENVTYLGSSLNIGWNYRLHDLDGLQGLSEINGPLKIVKNDSLSSLDGLDNITKIDGDLWFEVNPMLSNLDGLKSLKSINGELDFWWNESLLSLKNLDSIDANSISYLNISENPNLSLCNAKCVCDYLAIPGASFEIANNAAGCNSSEEVENACKSSLINEYQSLGNLLVYPNPGSGIIRCQWVNTEPYICTSPSQQYEFQIIDIFGQNTNVPILTVEQGNDPVWTIDVSELPPGVYCAFIRNGHGITGMGRFIVDR